MGVLNALYECFKQLQAWGRTGLEFNVIIYINVIMIKTCKVADIQLVKKYPDIQLFFFTHK